jgi:hypothetical protein
MKTKGELEVEVYVVDEVNDRELYVKTVKVKSQLSTFQLKSKDKLKDVFHKVISQLEERDKVKKITTIINVSKLEMFGEFEQKGNYVTLKLKIK